MGRVSDAPVVVLMLPFPAQGHLTPLLHFSRLLALRRLPVVFFGSSAHNRQAKLRLQGWTLTSFPSISFHDLPLPPCPVPDPDPESVIKFPAHLQPVFDASDRLAEPLDQLLGSLSATSKRVVIVHDPLMSFAAELGSRYPNVESFAFRCISGFSSLSFQLNQQNDLKPVRPNLELVSPKGCFTGEFLQFVHRRHRGVHLTKGEIFNTFHDIEGEFVEKLSGLPQYNDRRIWGIGPIIPLHLEKRSDPKTKQLINWLDKQPDGSVLYVSFGSNSSLSSAQISELAAGLERSGQRFLWVLRAPDRGDIFKKGTSPEILLPEGFEKRVSGSGLVERGWVPQLQILSHGAVGGFLSHCGWNSCMESLSLGVPLATWPLHSDQPANAQLMTEVLKVGVVVREWGVADEMVPADKIEKAVRRLMVSTEESMDLRKRCSELRDAAWRSWARAGSSRAALDSFVDLITRP